MASTRLLKRVSRAAWRATRQHLATRFDPTEPKRSWRQEMVLELMRRDMQRIAHWPPWKVRQREMATPLRGRLRQHITVDSRTLGGRPCLSLTPSGWTADRATLIYLHGGGYCVCSPKTHRALAAQLAIESGMRTLLPDYRLAPEHPFPAAIDDAVAACRELQEELDGQSWFLGGDSAGGGLSLAAMLTLRDASEPLPTAAVLMSPWVDLTLCGASIDAHGPVDYLNRSILESFSGHYLGEASAEEPLASLVLADLHGLPPMRIQVGGAEVFTSEVEELGRRLEEAGVEHRVDVFPGACHVFQAFAPLHPDADRGLRELGLFLRDSAQTTRSN